MVYLMSHKFASGSPISYEKHFWREETNFPNSKIDLQTAKK